MNKLQSCSLCVTWCRYIIWCSQEMSCMNGPANLRDKASLTFIMTFPNQHCTSQCVQTTVDKNQCVPNQLTKFESYVNDHIAWRKVEVGENKGKQFRVKCNVLCGWFLNVLIHIQFVHEPWHEIVIRSEQSSSLLAWLWATIYTTDHVCWNSTIRHLPVHSRTYILVIYLVIPVCR